MDTVTTVPNRNRLQVVHQYTKQLQKESVGFWFNRWLSKQPERKYTALSIVNDYIVIC